MSLTTDWERRRGNPKIAGDAIDGQARFHLWRVGGDAGGIYEIDLVDDFIGRGAAILDAGGLTSDGELTA